MKHRKLSQRLLAWALSAAMILGMLPSSIVAAENQSAVTSGEIVTFEPLLEATAAQTVALGTPLEDLDLPNTLKATIRLAGDTDKLGQDPEHNTESVQQDTTQSTESVQQKQVITGEAVALTQEEADTGYTETIALVPVKQWTATPDYNSNTAGEYVFIPEIEGFTLSSAASISVPTITVTVQETVKGTITAFEELTEGIRWQNTAEPFLPEELTGTVEGKIVQIPVTWEADHEYNSESPAIGLYVFTAKPGEGYAIAANTEAPRITVYIPARINRTMRLMAGSGTSTSPLEITTASQLMEIAVLVNAGRLETFLFNNSSATVSLKLMNDLDLSAYGEGWNDGKGWEPIGTISNPFRGTFDGGGFTITGLYINRTEEYNIGLFGYVSNGTVKNLKIVEARISGYDNVGSVAGYVAGASVTNCFASGSVIGSNYVAGIAGHVETNGRIEDCSVTSYISGSKYVGGITGYFSGNGSMTNCSATGTISGNDITGGIAGNVASGSVTNCWVTGPVSGNDSVGGIAGNVEASGSIEKCCVTGSVRGNDSVGGVAGYIAGGSVINCCAINSVSGSDSVGGVVGYSDNDSGPKDSEVINCYATGAVRGHDNVGGVVGCLYSGYVMNCYATGTVTGENGVGGIAGNSPFDFSFVLDCAALNPSVSGTSNVGRVMGRSSVSFRNNAAYFGMTDPGIGKFGTITNSATDKNGVNITTEDMNADGTIGGRFTVDGGWTVVNGKLPILAGIRTDLQEGPPTNPEGTISSYFNGKGTSTDPYLISNPKQLAKLAELVNAGDSYHNGKYYKLTTSLDLSDYGKKFNNGRGWTPIGNGAAYTGNAFTGTFDGNGKKITGLYINSSTGGGYGLFGNIAGTVKDLGLENVSISITGDSEHVGGVAGYVSKSGKVINCYVTGSINCYKGKLENGYYNGGVSYVGGVVGYLFTYGSVTNCFTSGTISGGKNVGGIVGGIEYGNVSNCYVTASVSGADQTGGIVGYLFQGIGTNGNVTNCYATGPVSGYDAVGGLIGLAVAGSMTNCYATGLVSGRDMVGGLVGCMFGIENVTNCAALNPSVSGAGNKVGNVAGQKYTLGGISNNVAFSKMKLDLTDEELAWGTTRPINTDILVDDLTTTGIWTTILCWPSTEWSFYPNQLPILKSISEDKQDPTLPQHIGSGGSIVTDFDGAGTVENPYEIKNARQLVKLAELVNTGDVNYKNKHYKLSANLDLSAYGNTYNSGQGWAPIGTETNPFGGTFDGDNNKITGLTIINSTEKNSGLFGFIDGGVVHDLEFDDVRIIGGDVVGAVAGYMKGGSVTNCKVSGTINSSSDVGAVAGYVDGGSVTNCNVTVTISGSQAVGGVAGYLASGNVANCNVSGIINGNQDIGGVAGYTSGSVSNCYTTGTVDGDLNVGGVAGYIGGGRVSDCYTTSTVNGDLSVGGVAGFIEAGSLSKCYTSGSVSGNYGVGGVVGYVEADGLTENCYATGWVKGSSSTGGVAGYVNGNVTNCYATGSVSGSINIGGVAGYVDSVGKLTYCYSTSSVSASKNIGGVAGIVSGRVTNCAALNPSINGISNVGRVVGIVSGGLLTNNAAFIGMNDPGKGKFGSIANSLTDKNGTSVSSQQISKAGFWTEASNWGTFGWDTSIWTIIDDKLPILNKVGGTQPNEFGLYMIQRDISYATVKFHGNNNIYTYTGACIIPSLDVTFDNVTLVQGQNYTVNITSMDGVGTSAGTNMGTVTFDIVGIENFEGTITGLTYQIVKAAAPSAPTVTGSYTGNGSTFTYKVTPISGAQYRMDDDEWQDENEFSGIVPGSTHTFSARIKETDACMAGKEGKTGVITFNKLKDRATPALSYTVSEGDFPKIVTITKVDGAEYSFNGIDYGSTNTYTSYSEENITLSIRLKETATHYASQASSEEINTANKNQSALPDFELIYVRVNDASYTVTIPATEGAQYSFDGIKWSDDNTKTGCRPGDTITGYKRLVAKTGYNVGPTTSASVTLPLFQVKTPIASPNGGTFTGSRSVTLSCATADASIYYTIDGSMPTVGSTLYTGAFMLTKTATVKAIAVKQGMTDSGMLSITFTRYTGGDGNNGGGGYAGGGGFAGGGGAPIPGTTETTVKASEKKINQPLTVVASVTATAGENGVASASVSDKVISDAIAKAQSDAASQGKTEHGIAIELNVTMPKGAVALTAVFSRNALNSLVSAGVSRLIINGSLVRIDFDKIALAEIQRQSTGDISISVAPKNKLTKAAKKMVGTRPVYDITVGYGKDKKVSSFGSGTATVSIPYSVGKKEVAGGLYAVYVDKKGNATRIAGSTYDANSGCVIFTTNHFSQYGVGYTAPTVKYTDISSHWAKEAIDYVVGRGLITGTSDKVFAPDAAMTRGMLVMALGKLSGVNTKVYTTSSFTDVKEDSEYRPYIEWAVQKGIIQDIGNKQFAPDRAITREELAVIFVNYAKAIGYTLPVTREAVTFADAVYIGNSYSEAVISLQQAGIMMGKKDKKFNPKANATRAEVCAMLYRYIKLTINPDTAQGWALNDDGQDLYYKDGKMVSGKWIEIDGKWYYFYADGTLARNTKIDGYEIDKNGARKEK